MNRNMTIPSRPAPPPPQATSTNKIITRYSPATNWDDTPFGVGGPQGPLATALSGGNQISAAGLKGKKAPPPRPPPPKVVPGAAPLKKPGQQQSINILSNLFGGGIHKRNQQQSHQPQQTQLQQSQQQQQHHHPLQSNRAKTPITGGGQQNHRQQLVVKLPPPPKQPPPLGGGVGAGGYNASNSSNGFMMAALPAIGSSNSNGGELISFDSPPASPTFTQKSCSDCISVDSFSSDSNYSSPANGNASQTESGFEDDFVAASSRSSSARGTPSVAAASGATSSATATKDLWDLSDPFGLPPGNASSSAAKFTTTGSGNHYAAPPGSALIRAPVVNSKLYEPDFVDPLCNGKSAASKVQTVAMPTIIKSVAAQKPSPLHSIKPKPTVAPVKPVLIPSSTVVNRTIHQGQPQFSTGTASGAAATVAKLAINNGSNNYVNDVEEEEEDDDSLPSLPMPSIPPPPPPPAAAIVDGQDEVVIVPDPVEVLPSQPHEQPYGIALYDFDGETYEDLTFKANEKIYILKRLNDEWLHGRNRRGCEGMFPANYIEIKVGLPGERPNNISSPSGLAMGQQQQPTGDISLSGTASFKVPPASKQVRVMYTFNAETAEDLTIVENELVTVLYQITPEWLYGELHGQRGQFPANFIEYVPPNLPLMPAT